MIKHWKPFAGLVAALVAAGLAVGSGPAAAQSPVEPAPPGTITVTGSGTVTVEPDTAVLTVGVQANEPTGAAAMERVTADSNRLTEALLAAGVAAEDVQTSGINLWSLTGDDGVTVTGYQASLTVTVAIRDIAAVGATIDAAHDAVGEGFTIAGVSFSFSDPESVLQAARAEAVANAGVIAQQYADAAGVTLGAIVSLVDVPFASPVLFGRSESMSAADANVAISPGTLDLNVQITATYGIGQ
jgi:hypothetical protein